MVSLKKEKEKRKSIEHDYNKNYLMVEWKFNTFLDFAKPQ